MCVVFFYTNQGGTSAEDIKLIVDYHNRVRREVSPAATNMPKMVGLFEIVFSKYLSRRSKHNCLYRTAAFEAKLYQDVIELPAQFDPELQCSSINHI